MTAPKTLPPDPPSLKGGGAASRPCPRCKAAPREPCTDRNGQPRLEHSARSSEAAGREPRRVDRDLAWARKHLGDLPEAFVLSTLWGLALSHGRGNVTPAMVREHLERRFPWAVKEAYCPRCRRFKPRRGRKAANGRLVCSDCTAGPTKGGTAP